MKTIVCGPPHSGKSVLIANLLRYMPSDSYLRINANGDGEGTWSNNTDQEEVLQNRHKSRNTPEKFSIWASNIKSAFQDVVLIDIGGKLQDDKGPLFDAADIFIVLSSNPDVVMDWIQFGEAHGCKCLAVIDSTLDGKECIFSERPYLHAQISRLERGCYLSDSGVLKTLADHILVASGYKRTRFIDFTELGEKLGCASSWNTSQGIPVTHLHFEAEHGPELYRYLKDFLKPFSRYSVYGLKTNWIAAIASICLQKNSDSSSMAFFDDRTGSYRSVSLMRKSADGDRNVMWKITETDEDVFLSLEYVSFELDRGDIDKIVLPVIDETKRLFFSGRLPMWTVASIMISYKSKEQYLFQPGNHYICVKSEDVRNLGTSVDVNLK